MESPRTEAVRTTRLAQPLLTLYQRQSGAGPGLRGDVHLSIVQGADEWIDDSLVHYPDVTTDYNDGCLLTELW